MQGLNRNGRNDWKDRGGWNQHPRIELSNHYAMGKHPVLLSADLSTDILYDLCRTTRMLRAGR